MKIWKLQTLLLLAILFAIGSGAAAQNQNTKTVITTGDTSLTITRVDEKTRSVTDTGKDDLPELDAADERKLEEEFQAELDARDGDEVVGIHTRPPRAERRYDSRDSVGDDRRGPITSDYQQASMRRLQKELDLADYQVDEIQAILSGNLQQKNKNISTVRRQIVQQRRDLADVLTREQMEIAAGLYIQRTMSISLMPGPGETGFRKYRVGKPQPEIIPLEERDLEAESKALDALEGTEE